MGKIFPCKSKLENIHCIEAMAMKVQVITPLNTPTAIIVNNRSSFPNIYNFVSNILILTVLLIVVKKHLMKYQRKLGV